MLVMCDDRRFIRGAVAAIIAALVMTGCGHAAPAARTITAAKVPVVSAAPGSVTPRSTLGGLIVPFQNVQIVSTLVEPTDHVFVNEGDHVHRGQVLAQLDTADLVAELDSYNGTIASDEAKTQQTYLQAGLTIQQNSNSTNASQAAVRQAQQTLARIASISRAMDNCLNRATSRSKPTMRRRRSLQTTRKAFARRRLRCRTRSRKCKRTARHRPACKARRVASVKADEQTTRGLADQIKVSISKATIVSPIDGVVVNRNLNPGEYPGTRQIFTLQETDKVYAVLNGSGGEIVGVQTGSPVKIISSDSATLRGSGKVTAVLDQITPGSTNFVIKAVLPNPTDQFRSGMVVTGLVSRPTTTGMTIPRTAFNDDTQTTVQTIIPPPATGAPAGGPRQPNVIKTIPVTMVAEDDKNAVVQGLHKGQVVVLNGQLGLSDGQPAVACRGAACKSAPQKVAER